MLVLTRWSDSGSKKMCYISYWYYLSAKSVAEIGVQLDSESPQYNNELFEKAHRNSGHFSLCLNLDEVISVFILGLSMM